MIKENWLSTILLDNETQTVDNTVKKIDLPTSNFIGNIHLRCGATINNQGNDADFTTLFIDMINSIKVIGNGFATILDLTPKQLRAIMTPTLGHFPFQNLTHKDGEKWWIDLPICFGRYPYDTDYVLPAKAFQNLQLEIDYNLSDTSDPGFDTGTFEVYCAVDELVSDASVSSKKIIRRTAVETGTTKSGNIDVELPRGGIYKRILAMCEDDDAEEGTDITKVQLRINNGAEIPITARWVDLQMQNMREFGLPPATLEGVVTKADADTIITELGSISEFQLSPEATLTGSTNIVAGGTVSGGTITCDINNEAAYSTVAPLRLHAKSKSGIPESVVIAFDKNLDMSLCPDSSQFNDATLRLTGANANGTYAVVLEEVVSL